MAEADPCDCDRNAAALGDRLAREVRDFESRLAAANYVLNANYTTKRAQVLHTPACRHVADAIASHNLDSLGPNPADMVAGGAEPRALLGWQPVADWPGDVPRRCSDCAPVQGQHNAAL